MTVIDLHIHSRCSDGTEQPAVIVRKGRELGLEIMALTDHDTVLGNREWLAAGAEYGIRAVPGVEFSVENHAGLKDIDILGYFPDRDAYLRHESNLQAVCARIAAARIERVRNIVAILAGDGLCITVNDILPPGAPVVGSIGRKHIAIAVLAHNRDRFATQQQIFDDYLGDGGKADVPIGFQLTITGAAELIHAGNGIAVCAHPGVSNGTPPDQERGKHLIRACFAADCDGAEGHYLYDRNRPYVGHHVITSAARLALCWEYIELIKTSGKLYTAGSDYHGANKDIELGECENDDGVWRP